MNNALSNTGKVSSNHTPDVIWSFYNKASMTSDVHLITFCLFLFKRVTVNVCRCRNRFPYLLSTLKQPSWRSRSETAGLKFKFIRQRTYKKSHLQSQLSWPVGFLQADRWWTWWTSGCRRAFLRPKSCRYFATPVKPSPASTSLKVQSFTEISRWAELLSHHMRCCFCTCLLVAWGDRRPLLSHTGGKYSPARQRTLCALWFWKCNQSIPEPSGGGSASGGGGNQEVSFLTLFASSVFSFFKTHNLIPPLSDNRYTTLSYRAPEMVNLYGGQVITTKADIWVGRPLSFCYQLTV